MGLFDKFLKRPARRDRIARETIDLSPPGVEGNVTYHDIDFVDCDFIMSDRWPQFLMDCNFQSCRFTLEKSLRGFGTRNATFVNCDFLFKRASNWRAVYGERFESCRFKGRLKGSKFGDPRISNDRLSGDRPGYISECDFTELNLDEVQFYGLDTSTNCKFPGWPLIGYTTPEKRTPIPAAIQALPQAFHDKCCTVVSSPDAVYLVNVGKLDLDRAQIELLARTTKHILIFGE